MQKIYKENQLLEVNSIQSEVIESIKVKIDILNENYGADRDIEADCGYVLIAENIVDIEILKYAEKPQFKQNLKETKNNDLQKGFKLYYTSQCPFTAKYVPLLEEIAKKRSVDFQAVHILTREQAQNTPTPFTTFSLPLSSI